MEWLISHVFRFNTIFASYAFFFSIKAMSENATPFSWGRWSYVWVVGSLTIPRAIYKVTERATSTLSSGHTAAQWASGTGDTYWPQAGLHWPVLLLPHGFLVSASVTKGPPDVKMLHYNKTWWRVRDPFLTLSPSSLSHPTATERQRQSFLSCICMWQHLLWRKEGTFFACFSCSNPSVGHFCISSGGLATILGNHTSAHVLARPSPTSTESPLLHTSVSHSFLCLPGKLFR